MALPVILLAPVTTTAGAKTNIASTPVSIPGTWNAMAFVLDVSAAATAVGDTLNVKVQVRLDGTNWLDVCAFTEVLGNGGAKRHFGKINADTAQAMFENGAVLSAGAVRNMLGESWRVLYTQVDDATQDAAFTFSVVACPM